MFRIMLRKLFSKWWLNLCLLLGCTLFIATVVSFPLYQNGAYDRMLRDEFQVYQANEGVWPAINRLSMTSKRNLNGSDIRELEGMAESINEELEVTPRETIYYYVISQKEAHSAMNRKDVTGLNVRISTMSDLPKHAKMLSGEMYSESGMSEDGCIEVVISQAGLVSLQVLVGETIVMNSMKDADGNEIRLLIKGVFAAEDGTEDYWQVKPDSMDNILLMNTDLFRQMFTGENASGYAMFCNFYSLFEYEDIKSYQAEKLLKKVDYLTGESEWKDKMSVPAYRGILEDYVDKEKRIHTTLTILQIPVLIMLAAFLFMLCGQMYEMERNEISVIKSRGSSGMQIFRLYLYQSMVLAFLGGILGVPLGAAFSRILGSARNFLEFDSVNYLDLTFTKETWIYAGAAMSATLLIMAFPAVRHSKITIVNLKQQKAVKKRSWWEKVFLDFIFLGISLYGYYSFHKNTQTLKANVLMGKNLDPLLYISSSLFIVGLGLLFLRLQPLLVRLIYLIGKKFWGPASYVSFMENVKNGRKQQFIMLFLIMTISMGMFHATVARTILQNARENTAYLDGADIVLKEFWKEITDDEGAGTGNYYEPDYTRFTEMEGVEGCTRVFYDGGAYLGSGRRRQNVTLMGIHTREFGTITWVDTEYLGKPYYAYLNELAMKENGVLVSANLHRLWGVNKGDSISYTSSYGRTMTGVVVDYFDYWPGYVPSTAEVYPDGTVYTTENFLLVTHYDLLRQKWGIRPYEVWMDLKEGYGSDYMYQYIEGNELQLVKYRDRQADLENTVKNPLLQGTNGVLTMGFMVTILLCAVGYIIYWVMSIRSRELVFGVLRACGMHKGELFHMLMNEQIFSGIFSIFAGIGTGKLTSHMFVPLMQQAYAASEQVLPMKLVVYPGDMIRLYAVIGGVVIACLLVLVSLLYKLNVSKALKLGEE